MHRATLRFRSLNASSDTVSTFERAGEFVNPHIHDLVMPCGGCLSPRVVPRLRARAQCMSMEAVEELDGPAVAPLRENGDYVRLAVGEVLSAVGTSAAIFVLPLVALQLARSAAIAGLVGAA